MNLFALRVTRQGDLEAQRLRGQEVENEMGEQLCRSIIQELSSTDIYESKDVWNNKSKARKDSKY